METSKYSYSGTNNYGTSNYLKPNHKELSSGYGISSSMVKQHNQLDMQLEPPAEKGVAYRYPMNVNANESFMSEGVQNISTNYTSRSMLSQDFSNASIRNSAGLGSGKKQVPLPNGKKNQKTLTNVLNKASDFWAETLGFKPQENSAPSNANSNYHYKQRKEAVYHQQEPAVVKKLKQVPSVNSILEKYPINSEAVNFSENGYAMQNESSGYNEDNGNNDAQSAVSNGLRSQISQPAGTRGNTLYKYLNRYLDGNQQKLPKLSQTPLKATNSQLSQPAPQYDDHIGEPAKPLPEPLKVAQSASGGNSTNELLRLATASRFLNNSARRSAQKSGSSLLRSKLEATQTGLSSTTRVADDSSSEKPKSKFSQKLKMIEREQLVQLFMSKKEESEEKMNDEADRPKLSSQILQEHYTRELNSSAKKTRFSLQEDQTIAHYYKKHGSNWKIIAKYLPGRTESMIRNRFYSTIKKKKPELLNGEDDIDPIHEAESDNEKNKEEHAGSEGQNPPNEASNQSLGVKNLALDIELERNNTDSTLNNNVQLKQSDIESEFKELQVKNDGLFPEADLFVRDFFPDSNLRKNSCEIEFGCLSPVVNSCMPFEWEHSNLLVPDTKRFQEDPFGFSPKLESKQNEGPKHSKETQEENYLSYLIDFNEEPIANKEIDLENNSICSTAEKNLAQKTLREEERQVAQTPNGENERTAVKQSSKGSDLKQELKIGLMADGVDKSCDKIYTLVNQIKSIEMLFNITRKEIQRLQTEFGSN